MQILEGIQEWQKTHEFAALLISHSRDLLAWLCQEVITLKDRHE
jgi:ABC-type glutathione transport system ATPase component